MLNRALILATLVASSLVPGVAKADFQGSTTCRSFGGANYRNTSCTSSFGRQVVKAAAPMTTDELAQEEQDKAARIAEWEAFCKPVPKQDPMGVTRMIYAHEGCDLGRSK